MAEQHLLVTRFRIPPARARMITRERLIEDLHQSQRVALFLLSASAGFGKTTLLSAWARQSSSQVAWLSLDEQDNDPTHFWIYVVAALRTRFPELGETALALLNAPQLPLFPTVLTTLINELAEMEVETTLILDDYHIITEEAVHESLLFLLEHLPTNVHLMISSRVDPPLPLSRLRARGQMIEMRDADLSLSQEETGSFLRQVMGLRLEDEDVARLMQRTEGWIAGLQLAALSMRKQDDLSTLVRSFSGKQRFIRDYVRDEILQGQSPSMQRFLLQTSILSRVNADLCRAVTGESGSQEILDKLERANLFLMPLDEERQWYRFHPLFTEAVQYEAKQRLGEDALHVLYQKASRWYEEQDFLAEAIEIALTAQDFVHAIALIEKHIDPRNSHNELYTLRRWMEQLPEDLLNIHPLVCLIDAMTLLYTLDRGAPETRARVERSLAQAERYWQREGDRQQIGKVWTLRAEMASWQGDFAYMAVAAREALRLLEEDEKEWRAVALLHGGSGEFFVGSLDQAWAMLQQARTLFEETGNDYGARAAIQLSGNVLQEQGALHQAAQSYQRVLKLAGEDISDQAYTQLGLSKLCYEWNELERAEQLASRVQVIGQQLAQEMGSSLVNETLLFPASLLLAHIQHARGEHADANERLQTLLVDEQRQIAFQRSREVLYWHTRLQLARGELDEIESRAANRSQFDERQPFVQQEYEALLDVRILIAQGQAQKALCKLESWGQHVQARASKRSELQLLIVEALAHAANGSRAEGIQRLMQALGRARAEGYQRIFLDEGKAMENLLRATLPDVQDEAIMYYVQTLLRAFESEHGPLNKVLVSSEVLIEPLTAREQEVLHLLADGASNREIANHLVVSLATAKKHVANILSKLGAENRTQAIARARTFFLL